VDRAVVEVVVVAGGRVKGPLDCFERFVLHVLDVRPPARQRLDHPGIAVHARDIMARLAKRDGERQADIAEAHNSDLHRR